MPFPRTWDGLCLKELSFTILSSWSGLTFRTAPLRETSRVHNQTGKNKNNAALAQHAFAFCLSMANPDTVRKQNISCGLDFSSSLAASTLRAARANMVSVILEDNYIEFRSLCLGQHRAALKTLWTEEQTRGAHSRSCSLSLALQMALNSQASAFTQHLSYDTAVRCPNGTIICNLF